MSKGLLFALFALTTLGLSACAPATTHPQVAPVSSMGGRCVPVTGIAVQSVFDGDYGSQLSRWLTSKLGDAGFKAYRSTDYPDVNVASINITGLIDHWATPQDLTAPRVGVSDIQIVDRRSNALLSRFQTGQGSAFTAPTLPEYVDSLVEEIQRRYCQV